VLVVIVGAWKTLCAVRDDGGAPLKMFRVVRVCKRAWSDTEARGECFARMVRYGAVTTAEAMTKSGAGHAES
jgi:hypothetical protein